MKKQADGKLSWGRGDWKDMKTKYNMVSGLEQKKDISEKWVKSK